MMTCDDLFARHLQPLVPIPTGVSVSGQLDTPIRAILFDVYGTLFISGTGDIGPAKPSARSRQSLEELISLHGLGVSAEKLVQAFHDAIDAEHARIKSVGIEYPEIIVEKIWQQVTGLNDEDALRRFALAYELIVNPVWPMPGLDNLLSACRDADLVLGIVSNAQFYTPLLFRHICGGFPETLGFDPDLLVYSFAFGCAKPSPALFDAAVDALAGKQITPDQVLFVGNDMRNDIRPATAAGMRTALFAGDARSYRPRSDEPCCASLVPDLCITALSQILDHISIPIPRKLQGKTDPD